MNSFPRQNTPTHSHDYNHCHGHGSFASLRAYRAHPTDNIGPQSQSPIKQQQQPPSRHTQSESHPPFKNDDQNKGDDDSNLLANLAAIQLLSGCVTVPSEHILSRSHRSVDLFGGDRGGSNGQPGLTLHMVSTLSVTVHHNNPLQNDPNRRWVSSDENQAPPRTTGGRLRSPPRERAHQLARSFSCARTAPPSHEQFGSEDLDLRLRLIDEALLQDRERVSRRNRRACTSEASHGRRSSMVDQHDLPLDTSQTLDSVHCDRSRYRPSPGCQSNPGLEQSLKDRISQRAWNQSHSSNGRYASGLPSPRGRRRKSRYTSICISSAESSPLFNTPASHMGEVPVNQAQPKPNRSHVKTLAAAGLMYTTREIHRLAARVEEASQMCESHHSMPEPSFDDWPSSNTSAGMSPTENLFTGCKTTGTPFTSPPMGSGPIRSSVPLNSPVDGVGTPPARDATTGALYTLRKHRRKTSSRLSEICTPENIPEGSDEDGSLANSVSTLEPPTLDYAYTPSSILQPPVVSLNQEEAKATQRPSFAIPDASTGTVYQGLGGIHSTQDELAKILKFSKTKRRSKTSDLRVGFADPLSRQYELDVPRSPVKGLQELEHRSPLKTSSSCPEVGGNKAPSSVCAVAWTEAEAETAVARGDRKEPPRRRKMLASGKKRNWFFRSETHQDATG